MDAVNKEYLENYEWSNIYKSLIGPCDECGNPKEYNWRSPTLYNSCDPIWTRNGDSSGCQLPKNYWYSNGEYVPTYADKFAKAAHRRQLAKVMKELVLNRATTMSTTLTHVHQQTNLVTMAA